MEEARLRREEAEEAGDEAGSDFNPPWPGELHSIPLGDKLEEAFLEL